MVASSTEHRSKPKPGWQLALLFLVVFASRLPFLNAGYGVNIDAWRVARVASSLHLSGQYAVSRFPGYPIQEIVCSWVSPGGAWALNGLSAAFSAIAATAFAAIVRRFGGRDWFVAGLALAATPIFFVSSVCAKDYVWALAFGLLSVLSAVEERPALAGLLLGIATGCRITSFALVLPLAVFVWARGRNWRNVVWFVSLALLSASIAFAPVWSRYGVSFFTFYENHARPDWLTVLRRGTLEPWGVLGLIGLGAAGVSLMLSRKTFDRRYSLFAMPAAIAAIYIAAYLRLPDQAGYLLPLVPCVLFALFLGCNRRTTQLVCACLLLASFLDFSANGPDWGAIITDHRERLRTMASIQNFLSFAEHLPGENVIVVGGWEPQIAVMTQEFAGLRNRYLYAAQEDDLSGRGTGDLFYLPLMREFNYRINGLDLAQYGGHDLRAFYEITSARRAVP